ncbi:surface glycoprotein [Natronorubrum aibiense]|uniref:PGF-CTERM sorting domain-containing protein n=1 Tax=Natronorubrum aibiense TaxID=348826 RepID=A0A5P9NZZ8_9EURY|nr:surface glycoprotein [Natronorubrum aibiense]QFU81160.1 hypothetical protein GCU68_00635 [Natronorubrum aibiense]
MTNETSYREKGRALFLAALMVMSVVAMSAAFAGAAAANHSEETTITATDGSGDRAYQGQNVTAEGVSPLNTDNNTVDLYSGDYDSDDDAEWIREVDVDTDNNNKVTIETDNLESGTYSIVQDGATLTFSVRVQDLSADFEWCRHEPRG